MSETTAENLTEAASNGTTRTPSTPEGMAVAYGSLLIMALIPIFFGAFRSVKAHREQKKNVRIVPVYDLKRGNVEWKIPFFLTGTTETMSQKDAAMFPIIASGALFGLYIVFQIFSKEYINLLLTFYFFCLGVLALCHLTSPLMSKLVPASIPNVQYKIHYTRRLVGSGSPPVDLINYSFTSHDVVCLVGCSAVGLWYLLKKHWIGNNLFGLAFAINGVELLHLNNVVTGAILLSGLFIYDIFWVFGTNVMVTVAKSFEAPIKLVFPQDILEKGLSANNFAMLGLGDIVIPGIFIALLLRFDQSLKRKTNTYFYASFIAYILGLASTIFVMHVFKHAQPALLYLVPACLGTPLLLAVIKGDLKAMLKYEDAPEKPEKVKEGKKEGKKNK